MTYLKYLETDHLGSLIEAKDLVRNINTPYGERDNRIGEDFNIVDFTLKSYDRDIQAIRMGRRYYDPKAKLFLTPDSYFIEKYNTVLEKPTSANLYSYAGNNPVSRVDPSGDLDIMGVVSFDAGEKYGESAAQFWADTAYRAEKNGESFKALGSNFMGAMASLWTKETSTTTFDTLSGGLYVSQFIKPKTLYHFTSKEGAREILKTGVIQGGKGLTGKGVYVTRYKSRLAAKLQGAKSTQVRIPLRNVKAFKAQRNSIPGIFKSTKDVKIK